MIKKPNNRRVGTRVSTRVVGGAASLVIFALLSLFAPPKEYKPAVTTTSPPAIVSTAPLSLPIKFPIMPPKETLLKVTCIRVVDGDTAWFDEENIASHNVRFIGIDTPETKHPKKGVEYYGKEASDYTKAQLSNKTVYLEYDVERSDKYARHLCYIWLEDGTLFNLKLVEEGYAVVSTCRPNVKYREYFVEAESKAKEKGIGLWGKPK